MTHPALPEESVPLRVLIVAEGAPEQGGIPTFVAGLMKPDLFGDDAKLTLLNTTRREAERRREAGSFSGDNVKKTLVDAWRTFRLAREADVVHVQSSPLPIGPLLRAAALCGAGRLAGAGVILHVHASLESREAPLNNRLGTGDSSRCCALPIAESQ